MTDFASCLYVGEVVHQRLAPRRHHLRYRMFQGLFDLDELPELSRGLRWFSHNRLNLFSFHDADHGDGASGGLRTPGALRAYVERTLATAGIDPVGGRIALLCMPRILGFVFNPLSIYYCHRPDGGLAAMIYEVNNTFGQRHSYLIPANAQPGEPVSQACAKRLHVSPFMDMDMTYDFRLTAPGERISTVIHGRDSDGAPMIFTAFNGERRAMTDGQWLRLFAGFPLLTVKVVLAIHWEAVKLLIKGVRLRPQPPAPEGPVTLAHPN